MGTAGILLGDLPILNYTIFICLHTLAVIVKHIRLHRIQSKGSRRHFRIWTKIMGDFVTIAEQFVTFYYQAFDSDRSALAALYKEDSMMTWEKEQYQSSVSIVEKLSSLPFEKVQHRVDTKDAQPGV